MLFRLASTSWYSTPNDNRSSRISNGVIIIFSVACVALDFKRVFWYWLKMIRKFDINMEEEKHIRTWQWECGKMIYFDVDQSTSIDGYVRNSDAGIIPTFSHMQLFLSYFHSISMYMSWSLSCDCWFQFNHRRNFFVRHISENWTMKLFRIGLIMCDSRNIDNAIMTIWIMITHEKLHPHSMHSIMKYTQCSINSNRWKANSNDLNWSFCLTA